jgi:hypothetical protein
MVFKLMQSASKKWRLLNGYQLLPEVVAGVPFIADSNPIRRLTWAHPQDLTVTIAAATNVGLWLVTRVAPRRH